MKLFARVALVGLLAAAPVALTGTPAAACGGVQCMINCVHDAIEHGYCRL